MKEILSASFTCLQRLSFLSLLEDEIPLHQCIKLCRKCCVYYGRCDMDLIISQAWELFLQFERRGKCNATIISHFEYFVQDQRFLEEMGRALQLSLNLYVHTCLCNWY